MKTIISLSAAAVVDRDKIKSLQEKKRVLNAKFKTDVAALTKKHKEAVKKIDVDLKAAGYKKPARKARFTGVRLTKSGPPKSRVTPMSITTPTAAELKKYSKHSGLGKTDVIGKKAHASLMKSDPAYAARHVALEKGYERDGVIDSRHSAENMSKLTKAKLALHLKTK